MEAAGTGRQAHWPTARQRRWLIALGVVTTIIVAAALAWRPAAAWWHFQRGQSDLNRHRSASALTHFERSIALGQSSPSSHLLAARAARRSGDLDKAQHHLAECQRLEKKPTEQSILEWAMLEASSGRLERVEPFLRRKVDENHPLSALIYEALVEGYLRVYRIFTALGGLREWLEKSPDHPIALSYRGRTWQRVHAYPKAVEDFRKVIAFDAERDDDRYRLAECLIETSAPNEAAEQLEFLRARRPQDSAVLSRLAFAWYQIGRAGDSIRLLDEVIDREPGNAMALAAHAQIDFQEGRIEDAEKYARRALDINPYDRQAHFTLYQSLASQPMREAEAKQQHAKLKELETRLTRLIDITNRYMPQRPRDPDLQYELATLLLALGQRELAFTWFESALNVDPSHAPTHRYLAEYYLSQGDEEKAALHRRQAQTAKNGT